MLFLIILCSIISACLAAAIMTYISLATPIGPWIDPVFVIAAIGIIRLIVRQNFWHYNELISCIAVSSGIAGISAVACSFSYPTLFFLNPNIFNRWAQTPVYFIVIINCLVIISGLVAFAFTQLFSSVFLHKDLPFPVSQIMNKSITASDSTLQSKQLFIGAIFTVALNAFQSGLKIIPNILTIFKSFTLKFISIPALIIRLDTAPMLISLGFITGSIIALPLFFGALSKIFLLEPLQKLIFTQTKTEQIILAWCAGMVIFGALHGICLMLSKMLEYLKNKNRSSLNISFGSDISSSVLIQTALVAFVTIMYFRYFEFGWLSLLYLFGFTAVCVYELVLIAARIGLAPLGRFATFVMLPGLIIFGYNPVQLTLVSTFVELCGGIAVDLMFGRKLSELNGSRKSYIISSQLIGLIFGAITIGFILWILTCNGSLGHPPLIAQRAYARSLLVNAYNFELPITFLGIVFAYILHRLKINSVLVISGLLMPMDYVFPLIIGSLISIIVKNREEYYPLCSGIFATNSLVMIIKSIFQLR